MTHIPQFQLIPALLICCLLCLVVSTPLAAQEWREPDPANTVYMDTDTGGIVIELAPRFAPQTVAQFLKLVRDGFYDGQSFYRVIDGFVAQGGDGSDLNTELKQNTLPAEFELSAPKAIADIPFVLAQKNDLFAAATGFIDGFPAAHDADQSHYWPVHCPATVAMARDNAPDTGSTDFYIVIGQAPRYLDRNLTVFGRVIYGMNNVQKIRRGPDSNQGVFKDHSLATQIKKASVAADLASEERLKIQIMNTSSEAFQKVMDSRRHRQHEFFHHTPPAVLDVCQIPIAVKFATER